VVIYLSPILCALGWPTRPGGSLERESRYKMCQRYVDSVARQVSSWRFFYGTKILGKPDKASLRQGRKALEKVKKPTLTDVVSYHKANIVPWLTRNLGVKTLETGIKLWPFSTISPVRNCRTLF
jgi:hypothetical protein